MRIVSDTIQYREQNNISRNDFMHLLIQLKNKGALDGESTNVGKISVTEIAAQARNAQSICLANSLSSFDHFSGVYLLPGRVRFHGSSI